jgi:hypothetical protein
MGAVAFADRRRGVRDLLAALSARQIAWLVFLSTLLIYFALVPWVSRRWWLTGDEPHYLVVTHSLLTDGDLELSNNYQEKDFTLFYVGDKIDPHIIIGPDGGAYPAHTVGLSVILLPAYALGYLIFGTHAGVLYFLNTIAALLAANVYLLSYEVTGRKFSSLLGWITTAFTVPLMPYAYQVYPEIVGALLLVWSLRQIRRGERTKPHIWLMVGVCTGLMPWLVSRFILLSAFLGAAALFSIAAARAPRRWHLLSIIALCLPIIFLGGLMVAFDLCFYGRIIPVLGSGDTGKLIPDFLRLPSLEKFAAGLVGPLFDQDAGLLIYSPLYLLSFVGALLLLKKRRNDGLLLSLPVASMYMAVSWLGFFPGWGIPYRYLVVILPLAGLFLAYAFQEIRSRLFRSLGLILFIVSLARTGPVMRDPLLAQAPSLQGEPGLFLAYNRLLPLPLREYIPSFRQQMTVIYAYGRATGEIGRAVEDPEAEGVHEGVASTQMVAWADREVEERGYILDRRWPEDEEYLLLLPPGRYSACFRMKSLGEVPPESVVAVIDIVSNDTLLARQEVTKGEVAPGGYTVTCLQFQYPGQQQFGFQVFFTDQADLWVDWVKLIRVGGPSRKWLLSALWSAALLGFTAYYYLRHRNKSEGLDNEISSDQLKVGDERGDFAFKIAVALLLLLTIVALGSYLWSFFLPRVFEAEGLHHLTGEVVIDDQASGGKAAYASRDMEKSALVYGPYEFFRPAEYEVRFRMKRGDPSAEVEVATIDVYGNASGVLALQTIMSDDFEETDGYQEFRLLFSNPATQALQFRVWFTGSTDLWVDKITLQRIP